MSLRQMRAPLYENMDFPPYEYRPYPKQVMGKGPDGKMVAMRAESQAEELRIISERDATDDPKESALVVENASLAEQLAKAQAKIAELEGGPRSEPVQLSLEDKLKVKKA